MSAQIISTREITGGRRGIAGYLGKGPVTGVAIVVLFLTAFLGGYALTHPGSASHDTDATTSSAFTPAVSAAAYYDDLMSQEGDWIQTMAARVTMRRAAASSDALMAQQEDWIHTMAARADTLQRIPSAQQRLLEENTILPGAWGTPYMESITPPLGQDR
jgi:hypothetical protein